MPEDELTLFVLVEVLAGELGHVVLVLVEQVVGRLVLEAVAVVRAARRKGSGQF